MKRIHTGERPFNAFSVSRISYNIAGKDWALKFEGEFYEYTSPEPVVQRSTGPSAYKSSPNGPSGQQPKGKSPLAPNGQSAPVHFYYGIDEFA